MMTPTTSAIEPSRASTANGIFVLITGSFQNDARVIIVNPEEATVAKFKHGDPVSWHYRSAIGHGYVQSVAHMGPTEADTMYNVRQVDNHVSATGSREPALVQHSGAALTRSTREAVEAAAKAARSRR